MTSSIDGNPTPLTVGDHIYIQPGTKSVLYSDLAVDIGKIGLLPVVADDFATHEYTPILGFAAFYLEDCGGSGNSAYVQGHFVKGYVDYDGTPGGKSLFRGFRRRPGSGQITLGVRRIFMVLGLGPLGVASWPAVLIVSHPNGPAAATNADLIAPGTPFRALELAFFLKPKSRCPARAPTLAVISLPPPSLMLRLDIGFG